MPKIKPPKTLEEDGIDVKSSPFDAKDCPDELRGLFQLVHDVKSLRLETFARTKMHHSSICSLGPRIQAAFDYDKWLYDRADVLAARCSNPDLRDRSEQEWVKMLHPGVMFRFDRDKQDIENLYHCFVCRRHYPQGSRPLINKMSERLERKQFAEGTETCEQPEKHRNLPNLDSQLEMAWYNDEDSEGDTSRLTRPMKVKEKSSITKSSKNRGCQIPDLTIGLCTYSLQNPPWDNRVEFLKLDQIRLFDRCSLTSLRNELELPIPNRVGDKALQNSAPQFPFGMWEAKSAVANYNSLGAMIQSASKVKAMLRCQHQVYEKSSISGVPLAWYFNSVGSYWTVYGCHIAKNSRGSKSPRYVLIQLWDGELREHEKALQLLYIMDMISIWAEYTYKPSICSCLNSLNALMAGNSTQRSPDLQVSFQVERLELNKTNFPWLLNPRWNTLQLHEVVDEEISLPSEWLSRQEMLSPPPDIRTSIKNHSVQLFPQNKNRNRSIRSLSQASDRGRSNESVSTHISSDGYAVIRSTSQNLAKSIVRQISPPSSEDEYVIPELHDYIWIQDRDPGNADLLILSISKKGKVTSPTVIFSSHDWHNEEFCQLIRHEHHRWHSDVNTKFLTDKNHKSYLQRIILKQLICDPGTENQLYIILPLELDQYRESLRGVSVKKDVFRPIEELLNLQDLLRAIKKYADRWCLCGRPNNEYSPDMVLCDNMNCEIGWYHQECLDMEEGDEFGFWLCPQCESSDSSTHCYSEDGDVEYDEDLYLKCTDRVQMTKAIAKVWAKHNWPKEDKILRKMEKISREVKFDSSKRYRLPVDEKPQERNPPGCWAVSRVLRDRPRMIEVAPSGMVSNIGDPSARVTTALRRSRPTRTR